MTTCRGLRVTLFEQSLRHEFRLRVGGNHAVDLLQFAIGLLAHTGHHGFLVHRIVGRALFVLVDSLFIAGLGGLIVLRVVVGVADTVIGVGVQVGAQRARSQGVLKSQASRVVAFLLKQGVTQVILRQTIVRVGLRR